MQDQINAISLLGAAGTGGRGMWGRAGPTRADHLAPARPAVTMCCPFRPVIFLRPGPRRTHRRSTRCLTTSPPRRHLHQRRTNAPCGSRSGCTCSPRPAGPCPGRLGDSGRETGVVLPCWWRLAAAMRSATCSTRSGWTRCSATASGRCRTCCSRFCATRNPNPHAWQGRCRWRTVRWLCLTPRPKILNDLHLALMGQRHQLLIQ